jgi:hypothetical protein
MGKNGRIFFDRPKPTVGCSASGRKRRRSKTNQMHQFLKLFIYFELTLYMFRTVFTSIIRISELYIQQQAWVKQILLSAC